MAYELGLYRKPGKPDRTARTPSEAVQYTWDGYKHVKSEDAPASEVPELTEAEMAKQPEAKDAEVVDLTNEPKPKARPQAGASNTAPRS